jgi:hypothetical protein
MVWEFLVSQPACVPNNKIAYENSIELLLSAKFILTTNKIFEMTIRNEILELFLLSGNSLQ